MNGKYTVLVSSCDAYEDLWEHFFFFLSKNWEGIDRAKIVLNTESKSFAYDGLNIETLGKTNSPKPHTWSSRLKYHLEQIDTEYVLFMLDDFFLDDKVDVETIDFCIEEMERDKNIVHFGFVPTLWENCGDNRFEKFERRKRNTPFRVNTQAGIWRRLELCALLRSHESPWDFEVFASIRSRLRKGQYYVAREGITPIFEYDWFNGGAVHRGRWTERAVKLLKANNRTVDFEERGFDQDEVLHPNDIPLRPMEKNAIGRTLIRIGVLFKHWRSLI